MPTKLQRALTWLTSAGRTSAAQARADLGAPARPISVTGNLTAAFGETYEVFASATFTDPTPPQEGGYVVRIRNGTATIGGTPYTVGEWWRVYHSGSWTTRRAAGDDLARADASNVSPHAAAWRPAIGALASNSLGQPGGPALDDLSNTRAASVLAPIKSAELLTDSYHQLALARNDLVAYWRFNESSGDLLDASGNGLNGTLVGSVTRSSATLSLYPSDSAAQFTGVGAFNLGNVLNFERTDTWTVEFLVTPLAVANGSNYAVISKLRSSSPFTGWEINLEGKSSSTARVGVYVGNTFPSPCILVKSEELLQVGQTYHVAVSFEPSGRGFTLAASNLGLPNVRIWINGREQALSNDSEVNQFGTVGSTIVHTGACYIGSQSNDSRRLNAVLDELAIYRGVVEYGYIRRRAFLSREPSLFTLPPAVAAPPRNLILDFDINTDCDDMADLYQALALRSRGDLNLLGIICSTKANSAAPATRAILDYWDAGSVPIGAYQGSLGAGSDGSVSGAVRDQFRNGDTRTNYTDDLTQYRTILAAAPDNSVSIVSTGFAISLKRLQDSAGDGISALTGAELIRRKVAVLIMVGNVYPQTSTSTPEFNAASDPTSWKQVIETWPTPIVFSGGDLGEFVRTAPPTNQGDLLINPTRFAFNNFVGNGTRQSWGQLGFWFIARPDRFSLSYPFTQTVNVSTGMPTNPVYSATANRYFLRFADKSPARIQAELNGLLMPYSPTSRSVQDVTAYTSATTVRAHQVGEIFTNAGATAITVFTLPPAAAGLGPFRFSNLDADGTRVVAAAGNTLRIGTSVSASGGNVQTTELGAYVEFNAVDSTQWIAMPATGTWTVT